MMVDVGFDSTTHSNSEMMLVDEGAPNVFSNYFAVSVAPVQASTSQTNDTQNLISVPQAPINIQSNYSVAAEFKILPSSSTTFVPYINQHKRWCMLCVEAGRLGFDCPGSGGRAKCKFQVCILFLFLNSLYLINKLLDGIEK